MNPREAAEQMPRLGKREAAMLRRLRKAGVAFKGPRGWRFRGDREGTPFKVADELVGRGLAFEEGGAPARLKLTPRGVLLGARLCGETKERPHA
ncbi:hypothetical protein [Stappia indica]|uniref:hypothetical protein n=1 Tax=Stappia indica TaxID=538381 RepID=UPI001D182A83|nr:hypothetical protein [Stappia indica]MCC4243397.1 hypothetical protein [Stappia indica]